MAFKTGQNVWAAVKLGTGASLTRQEGVIRQVLPAAMYQVFVLGLVLQLPETALTEVK